MVQKKNQSYVIEKELKKVSKDALGELQRNRPKYLAYYLLSLSA